MPQAERQMATVGLLMLVVAVLTMRHTGGKPLKLLGFTLLSVKATIWIASMGGVLLVFALLLADPGET